MENSINLWKFPYFSGKSMNVGHCHPKHHCNPCNSSPTTLVSIIISKNIMLSIQNKLRSKKTYTSELRRGPDPAPGRPGEGPGEPGRTCARAVFCLENSMSAHKKCSNFFLRQDFCLIFFCSNFFPSESFCDSSSVFRTYSASPVDCAVLFRCAVVCFGAQGHDK